VSRLSGIPVRVEHADPEAPVATIGGGVTAILAEIAAQLERLARDGEPSAIDLRSLPMSVDDRRRLIDMLGSGEANITLQADGESAICETAVPGVWWTEHRDGRGEVIAAFIEIARVPGILPVETYELRRGVEALRARIGRRHG
jgi:HupH hydrogenase expression protein, C-terminal conserved region